MSDCVDETVVLLVAPNLSDQKDGIQDKTGGNCPEEHDSRGNLQAFAPIENDPTETYGDGNGRKEDTERQKEENCLPTARDAHARILQARRDWKCVDLASTEKLRDRARPRVMRGKRFALISGYRSWHFNQLPIWDRTISTRQFRELNHLNLLG